MEATLDRGTCYIDKEALARNYRRLAAFLPASVGSICIVKCDAYGHGAVEEARLLESLGASFFGVACAGEAVQLRWAGIQGDILILSHTLPDQVPLLLEYNLIQTVGGLDYGRQLAKAAYDLGGIARIHFKIDTGMHRLGISRDADIGELIRLSAEPSLQLEGCFSHFAAADSFDPADRDFTYAQKERFDKWLAQARTAGLKTGLTHLAASAGIVNYPEFLKDYDLCRPGILFLGFDSGEMRHPYPREAVLSLVSKIEKIDRLPAGESIGYGRTYRADRDLTVATIPVGYGDGLPRSYPGGQVLVEGVRCPLIGRISMDQCCADVSAVKDASLFKEAVFIGRQGSEEITLREMADRAGTIPNEIAVKLTGRLLRAYR